MPGWQSDGHLLTEVGENVQPLPAPVDDRARLAGASLLTVKVRFLVGDVPGVMHTGASSAELGEGAVTVTVGWGNTETGTVTVLVAVRLQPPARFCDTTLSLMSKGDVGQLPLGLAHVTVTFC